MQQLLEKLSMGASFTLDLKGFLICLVLAFVVSLIAELMYVLFYENRGTGSQIHRSFILIGPSVTLLFICVQLSLPLSLGLLGALSIVRFRTPIKEPEEIGFLMLLIAGAIGIATFNFLFIFLLYLATFLVLAVKKWVNVRSLLFARHEGVLLVNLADDAYQARGGELSGALKSHFKGLKLESVSHAEGTTSLQYVFRRAEMDAWNASRPQIQKQIPLNKISVLFSRPARAA